MRWRKRFSKAALAALALGCAATAASAQKQYGPGVTDTEIKIGTTTPYSGPAFTLWQKRYEEPQWNPYEPYGYGTAFAPD